MLLRAMHLNGLALVTILAGCDDSGSVAPRVPDPGTVGPSFTASSGSTSTLLGRTTFSDPSDHTFKVKRMAGDWHFEVKGDARVRYRRPDDQLCPWRAERVA